MRLAREDGYGLLFAVVATTLPLLALTWFADNMSKEGPIGAPAYILPTAIGLTAAGLASLAAFVVGRRRDHRFGHHVGYGCLAAALLTITYCVGLNWFFDFAERFRR
jgi:hypothetical protein